MPLSYDARQRILANLDAGRLPPNAPQKMWAGYGKGHACDGCGEIISPTQVEWEATYADSRAYRVHLACAAVWEAERNRRNHRG